MPVAESIAKAVASKERICRIPLAMREMRIRFAAAGFGGPIRKRLFRPDKFDVALALNGGFFDRIQILLQTREFAGHQSRVLQGRRHVNDGITARHIAPAFSACQRCGAT